MTFLSKNIGVRRLAVVLSLVGVGASLIWEYETSPIVPGWLSYGAAHAALTATPGGSLVPRDDGSVVLIQTIPAEAARPPIESGGGWQILRPAHGEETRQIDTYYFARGGDCFAAMVVVVLFGLAGFALVHATAWIVQGFRTEKLEG